MSDSVTVSTADLRALLDRDASHLGYDDALQRLREALEAATPPRWWYIDYDGDLIDGGRATGGRNTELRVNVPSEGRADVAGTNRALVEVTAEFLRRYGWLPARRDES